jgi:hypothetical protein
MGWFPYCRRRWFGVTNLPFVAFCKRDSQPAAKMFGIHDFALFVTTGILLNLTPGPDTLYILGRSIAHGRRQASHRRWEFPWAVSFTPPPLL